MYSITPKTIVAAFNRMQPIHLKNFDDFDTRGVTTGGSTRIGAAVDAPPGETRVLLGRVVGVHRLRSLGASDAGNTIIPVERNCATELQSRSPLLTPVWRQSTQLPAKSTLPHVPQSETVLSVHVPQVMHIHSMHSAQRALNLPSAMSSASFICELIKHCPASYRLRHGSLKVSL
jgi:hypothetical protein